MHNNMQTCTLDAHENWALSQLEYFSCLFYITFVSIIPSVTSPISDKMASASGSPYFAPVLGLSLQNSLCQKGIAMF